MTPFVNHDRRFLIVICQNCQIPAFLGKYLFEGQGYGSHFFFSLMS